MALPYPDSLTSRYSRIFSWLSARRMPLRTNRPAAPDVSSSGFYIPSNGISKLCIGKVLRLSAHHRWYFQALTRSPAAEFHVTPVTGRPHPLGYDIDRCKGIMTLDVLRVLMLAGLLASCAAARSPSGEQSESARVNEHPATSVSRADTRAQRCVALAMYWEARGEGRQGMLAVGSVVLNRVEDDRFPDSACSVVYQGGETPPCQFSWWCDGKSDRPTHAELWSASLRLADDLLTARPQDPTHGALFFHNTSIRSPWRRERTAQIGNHIFYR